MLKQRFWFALTLLLIVTLLPAVTLGSSTPGLEPSQPDFPKAMLLVSAESLQNSIGASNLVIIDARTSGYETSHIPTAINMLFGDYYTWANGSLPVAKLNKKLSDKGLTRKMTYVIYDTASSWGAAGRIFWMLEYLGCTDVHILDGGWNKWVADARPTQTTGNTLQARSFKASLKPSLRSDKMHIANRFHAADFVIIDCRTDEEFIGYQLYGEARGGHIPGAVQIPYAWYFNSNETLRDYLSINTMLQSRGITKDKEVTAHCTVGIRSGFTYFVLRLMGYPRVSNYDASIAEWSADLRFPMEKAPRFSTIVYPAWVKALIDYHKPGSTTAPPPFYNYGRDHKYIIFETQWGPVSSAKAYKSGHIPGAVHSDSDIYENGSPRWFLIPDDQIHAAMSNMGITADTTVIVYSNSPSFAARLWWILKYAGLSDVRFLNGGYQMWLSNGFEGETTINYPVPATFNGTVRPQYLATTSYVSSNLGKIIPGDVRSYDEHMGAKSGYSYLLNRGRIPGAVWMSDGGKTSLVYHDSDATISSYTGVRDFWKKLGLLNAAGTDFAKEVSFYCGNGYRSSLTFLYAYLMGFSNMRNYSSGWSDWSTAYTEDPLYGGITPGWMQSPSERPVIIDSPFE
jgi:3-mercaptopyruvate sulfurtransferase SseA